jgi:predicted nucleic acid-binding protein
MVRKERGEAVGRPIEVLIDSDAFIGRYYPDDAHNKRASKLFRELKEQSSRAITTSMVIAETATVLSHKVGQDKARHFLQTIKVSKLPVIHIDENLQEQAIEIFQSQQSRGTSMTDCANVAVVKFFEIPNIFGFDKFYAKQFGIKLLQ